MKGRMEMENNKERLKVPEFEEIRKTYEQESAKQKTFKALVYGGMGVGKTNLLKTCRRPILVDSFDPGGTKTIRSEIEEGWIMADVRWEDEDPMAPTKITAWDKVYHQRKRSGLFDKLGTYAIDSATTLAGAAMNEVLKKAGRLGGPPFQQDYLPAMAIVESIVRDITNLPCDVILIAHEDVDKDEVSGRMFVGPSFVGKLRGRVPILFDEVYCALSKETSSGVQYSLLTKATGMYRARTRLGKGGIFETYEVQDIKALLKKVGYSTEDKPY